VTGVDVRWRATLPTSHITGLSAAEGRSFVTSERGILALAGPEVQWEAETVTVWGCVPLSDGLLVTAEFDGPVVREQRTGSVVAEIEALTMSEPVQLANGLLVFLASRQGERVLRATTVTGEMRWEVHVHALLYHPLVLDDHVVVVEGTTVRAFDGTGSPVWTVGRDEPGVVDGPLVGLAGGNVLVPIRADDVMGYLVVDPRQGTIRPVPAHLRPGALAVPLEELLVIPGWPDEGDHSDPLPTVTVVDVESGAVVLHHRVPAEARSMVAAGNGLVAVAGCPSWERWSQYRDLPGFDVSDECYVLFLGRHGVHAEWKAGRPVTGPLAVATDGDLLVPVSGDLVSLQLTR
jgi:PQQ-like domain